MPYSVNIIRLLEKVEPSTREVLLAVLEEIERQRETTVTKKEFNELKEIVKDLGKTVKELAEAQKKTEQKVNELAEAQKKSEQRLTRLEQTVAELAEAQKKTEQRLNELAEAQKKSEQRLTRLEQTVAELAEAQKKTEQRLNELAEAQKKTEQKVNELAEAQKKTEQRLNELAEAQKKTEAELKKLVGEHRKTRKQLGGLAHTVGYVLEDRAFVGLLPLLEREYGLKVLEPLKRDFVEIGPGKYLEVNILGKAVQDGKKFVIIGECKTQLKKEDINKFLKTLNLLKDIFTEEIFPVLVTYHASPQVQNYVRQKGLKLYFSYQFPLVF